MTALKSIKTQAYQIVFWQLIIIMGLAVGLFLLRGLQNGIEALLGGLSYWLPTLYFVWRVYAGRVMRTGRQFIIAFFAGEIGKLVSSAILFLLIVKYLPVTALFVLLGYVGAIIAFWIASVFYILRNPGAIL